MMTKAEWERQYAIMTSPKSTREQVVAACDAIDAYEVEISKAADARYDYTAQRWITR